MLFILLVEDNTSHVELISRAIEEDGLEVDLSVCKNIAAARELINLRPPDLVIADLNLPDGKGTELICFSQGHYDCYPVILMTSFGDEAIAVEAIKLGALDYFVKSSAVFSNMPKLIKRAIREWKNITTRQDVQKELLQKETEQREILNSMMNGVITIDENSNILTFNNVAEKIFGYSALDVIGESLSKIIPKKYQKEHAKGFNRYLKEGGGNVIGVDGGIDLEGQHKGGGCFPLRLLIGELPKDIKGNRRFIASCQDLTQLKQNEEQLRRSQKMDALGKLTGGIAHDYNNMLGIVLGYAELLQTMLKDRPELVTYVNEIMKAGERGVKLTKKLLSFSRKKNSDVAIFNINDVLHGERHMLEKTLTARIKLRFDLIEEELLVSTNRGEFEDAIINLSINAMHAVENNGELIIKTEIKTIDNAEAKTLQVLPADYVALSFIDSGGGIDEAIREKIFEPFYTTKGDLGTGLGLTQVYGFVKRNHGAITVSSEVGVGSCFTLYFPRSHNVAKEQSSDIAKNNSQEILGGKENVLIVDDEISLRNLTSEILNGFGYKTFTSESGEHALDILKKESIDIMISDVIMPEMDGYELANIVAKKYPDIKILMVSGFTDQRQRKISDTALHDNLLTKPYHSDDLLIKMRDLLD